MSVYKCSFRIYIIFYYMRPFNKTTATLVRPHLFSTLCTTPLGKMTLWLASNFGVKRLYSTFFMGGQHIFPDPNVPVSCGSESTYIHSNGANTFVCQHRWRVVQAMVTFANHVQDTPAEQVWSRQSSEEEPHTDAIVFSRGSRGLFAMGPGLEILGVSQDHPGKEETF